MNIQAKLDQFRSDNPFDLETQAKRLLAMDDRSLILYVVGLGLATAEQRQRHYERDFIKNIGSAPQRERLVPGRVTGSIVSVKVLPTERARNAARQLIADVWHCGDKPLGTTTAIDMANAIKREKSSSAGHLKNAEFYGILKEGLKPDGSDSVSMRFTEKTLRGVIERVYGEFRKTEAA
jgi:hypothetical protein